MYGRERPTRTDIRKEFFVQIQISRSSGNRTRIPLVFRRLFGSRYTCHYKKKSIFSGKSSFHIWIFMSQDLHCDFIGMFQVCYGNKLKVNVKNVIVSSNETFLFSNLVRCLENILINVIMIIEKIKIFFRSFW